MSNRELVRRHEAEAAPTTLSEMLARSVLVVSIEAGAASSQVHLLPHPEPGLTLVLVVRIRPGAEPFPLAYWDWEPGNARGSSLWAEVLRVVQQT